MLLNGLLDLKMFGLRWMALVTLLKLSGMILISGSLSFVLVKNLNLLILSSRYGIKMFSATWVQSWAIWLKRLRCWTLRSSSSLRLG